VKRRMEIAKIVALKVDSFYNDAIDFVRNTQGAVKEIKKSQFEKLREVSECAIKVSDVLNYIKRQAARHDEWVKDDFADKLLDKTGRKLRKDMEEVCSQLSGPPASEAEKQQIHLILIREYIDQIVAHCLYPGPEVKTGGQ